MAQGRYSRHFTWWGRRLGGGVAPAAGSCGAPSGHVSRSAVDVWDFLTGAGLSISLSLSLWLQLQVSLSS